MPTTILIKEVNDDEEIISAEITTHKINMQFDDVIDELIIPALRAIGYAEATIQERLG